MFGRKDKPKAVAVSAEPAKETKPPKGGASSDAAAPRPAAVAFDRRSSAAWDISAVSVIGWAHEKRDIPRQDAFALALVGDTAIAVVADGLGSSPLSEIGAATACQFMVAELAQSIGEAPLPAPAQLEKLMREIAARARTALLKAATQIPPSPKGAPALQTTLIATVAGPKGGCILHIGDGAGLALEADKTAFKVQCVSPPENGEYSNITFPLTMEGYEAHLRATHFTTSELVVLMSDGVTPFMMSEDQKSPESETLLGICGHLKEAANAEGVLDLTKLLLSKQAGDISDDDKTMFIVRRKETPA